MLVYEAEAALPIEVCEPTKRFLNYKDIKEEAGEEVMRIALYLIAETRGEALLRAEVQRLRMMRFYNCRVNERPFKLGQLVLRKMEAQEKGNKANSLPTGRVHM